MPRAFQINISTERRKLAECFHRIRKIIESTLSRMEDDPDKVSAALVDVCVKSIRQMTALLTDIERMNEAMERQERDEKERESIRASLPGKTIGNPTEGNNQFPPDPPPTMSIPELELPFPLKGLNG